MAAAVMLPVVATSSSGVGHTTKLPMLCCDHYPPGIDDVVLGFLDMADIVPLTRICGWQRAKVIRHITHAQRLNLTGGGREGALHGLVFAQMMAMNLVVRYARHLHVLHLDDWEHDNTALCVPRGFSSMDPVLDKYRTHARRHLRVNLAQIIYHNRSTWSLAYLDCVELKIYYYRRCKELKVDKKDVPQYAVFTHLLTCTALTTLHIADRFDDAYNNVDEVLRVATQLLRNCGRTITNVIINPRIFDEDAQHDSADVILFRVAFTEWQRLHHDDGVDHMSVTDDITPHTMTHTLVPVRPRELTIQRIRTPLDLSPLATSLTRVTITACDPEFNSSRLTEEEIKKLATSRYGSTVWRLPKLLHMQHSLRGYGYIIDAPALTYLHVQDISMANLRVLLSSSSPASSKLQVVKWSQIRTPNYPTGDTSNAAELMATDMRHEHDTWLTALSTKCHTQRLTCLPHLTTINITRSGVGIPLSLAQCIFMYNHTLEDVSVLVSDGITGDHIWSILTNNKRTLRTMKLTTHDTDTKHDDTDTDKKKHMADNGASASTGTPYGILHMLRLECLQLNVAAPWLSQLRCPVLTELELTDDASSSMVNGDVPCHIPTMCPRLIKLDIVLPHIPAPPPPPTPIAAPVATTDGSNGYGDSRKGRNKASKPVKAPAAPPAPPPPRHMVTDEFIHAFVQMTSYVPPSPSTPTPTSYPYGGPVRVSIRVANRELSYAQFERLIKHMHGWPGIVRTPTMVPLQPDVHLLHITSSCSVIYPMMENDEASIASATQDAITLVTSIIDRLLMGSRQCYISLPAIRAAYRRPLKSKPKKAGPYSHSLRDNICERLGYRYYGPLSKRVDVYERRLCINMDQTEVRPRKPDPPSDDDEEEEENDATNDDDGGSNDNDIDISDDDERRENQGHLPSNTAKGSGWD